MLDKLQFVAREDKPKLICRRTMPFAKLIIIQPGHASHEFKVEREIVTIGRALDNMIALEDDANVSRYHAEIERRADTFWLIELGSSNGTTVNDHPVDLDRQLGNGDLICLGGSTMIEFHLSDIPWQAQEERYREEPVEPSAVEPAPLPASEAPAINTSGVAGAQLPDAGALAQQPLGVAQSSTGISPIYIIGAIGGGLLLTAIVAGIFFIGRSGGCKASVRIVSPQSGVTINGPAPIRVDAEEAKCIDRVIYQLDGVKVASSEIPPYQAMLDPADISGLQPGNHVLTATIEDEKGNRTIQPDVVVLGFENARVNGPDVSPSPPSAASPGSGDQQTGEQRTTLSTADIRSMCAGLAKEVSPKKDYDFDLELIHSVQARTKDYLAGGFYGRARKFRDVINDRFVQEQGLDPRLGYVTAMSRSNFVPSSGQQDLGAQGDGLWRMQLSLAQSAGYLGRCGTLTLTDPDQKCAAIVASTYVKTLVIDLFAGDALYAVACFGMTPKEAAQWRDQHASGDRRDLWKVINSKEQRERLTRFFAAGIVGENPERFNLTGDSPLSKLYPRNQ
jgi:pSer/pThr/pTyr-binding forkhead associated (FHA) protein